MLAINVWEVELSVGLADWNRKFFNAAQALDAPAFLDVARAFPWLIGRLVGSYALELYLGQLLRLRWRAWLTQKCLGLWMSDQAYYRLRWAPHLTDNPDQRISEDVNSFVDKSVTLVVNFFYAGFGFVSFAGLLWRLSGAGEMWFPVLGTVLVPGYLFWGALAYAGLGTLIARRVSKPLVALEFGQEQREADFRYALVRVRENAESIAFYAGEPVERATLERRFGELLANWKRLIIQRTSLTGVNLVYSNAASIVPWVLVGGRYFAGRMKLGDLMQITTAFENVRGHLSVLVQNYATIAAWRATVDRLGGFASGLAAARVHVAPVRENVTLSQDQFRAEFLGEAARVREVPAVAVTLLETDTLQVEQVATRAPDGTPIGDPISFEVRPGERLLLTGPSGSGKSTLLRAIAGIWPHGTGRVRRPRSSTLMLSQRPYLPLGSLRDAVCYPLPANMTPPEVVAAALTAVGLGHLDHALDEVADWSATLSLGEQQRVAFARILVVRPKVVILDEATSALDEEREAALYRLVAWSLPRAVMLSVGHRSSLEALHTHRVALTGVRPPTLATGT